MSEEVDYQLLLVDIAQQGFKGTFGMMDPSYVNEQIGESDYFHQQEQTDFLVLYRDGNFTFACVWNPVNYR